jgi:predicted secreted acid phosphatase
MKLPTIQQLFLDLIHGNRMYGDFQHTIHSAISAIKMSTDKKALKQSLHHEQLHHAELHFHLFPLSVS